MWSRKAQKNGQFLRENWIKFINNSSQQLNSVVLTDNFSLLAIVYILLINQNRVIQEFDNIPQIINNPFLFHVKLSSI